jgi:hypothetical protein
MSSPLRQHRRRRAAENIAAVVVGMLCVAVAAIPAGFLIGLGWRIMVAVGG